jgi:inosine-uridine nucleoside N-ribohydrolase
MPSLLAACITLGAISVAAKKIPVYIDQDSLAGGSNVLSIAMLLLRPEIEVVGIGVIAGDSSFDDAVYSALHTVDACGASVPVAAGASEPLVNSREAVMQRASLWGPKGGDAWLGEWGPHATPAGTVRKIPGVPEPTSNIVGVHAAQLLVDLARRYANELVVITAGPLTNVALAVKLAPDIVSKIKAVYTMAGAVTVRSKFNFWWDAEAAAIFLRQNWKKKVLVTIDVSQKCNRFTRELLAAALPTVDGPLKLWLQQSFTQHWAEFNLPMWDELTVAVFLDPEIVTQSEKLYVGVDHTWGPHYGATLIWNASSTDNGGGSVAPSWAMAGGPWEVVTEVNTPRFEKLFIDTFRGVAKSEL